MQYNIIIAIYSPPIQYKNYDQWYFIYGQNKNKSSSVLLLHNKESEDNTKDQTQHYSGYDISKLKLNQNKIKTVILEEIIRQREKHEENEQINQEKKEINILV